MTEDGGAETTAVEDAVSGDDENGRKMKEDGAA